MPFDTPPGQVLSSVPSTSGRRRSSKLAGCAGVLFQIFHGKRLFPRKSLPAERPKQVASNHTDDKLPIAKLLLIADENRSGPLEFTDEEVEAENAVEVGACHEKAPQRTPGVVARLMGLETMPYPESVCGERKQSEPRKDLDFQLYTDTHRQDRCTSTEVPVQPCTSIRMVRTREFKTNLPAKFAARQRAKVQDDTEVLAKSPSLPPHHLDASFPLAVSSAKGEPFNKSSIRTRKAAHLLQAAPKTPQTSMQPNHQNRSQQIPTPTVRNKTGSLNAVKHYRSLSGREKMSDSKDQLINSEVQASGNKQGEIKLAQTAPRYTSNDSVSRRPTSDLQKPQLASRKPSPHEATLAKSKHGYQGAFGEVKGNISEKVKPDWRQQQETSKRLSQPTNCSTIKIPKTRLARHPSPPKSVQDSSVSASSSQASNCVPSSSVGTLASRVIKSHVGSNDVSSEQLSSSSVQGSLGEPKEVKIADGNRNILRNPDLSQAFEPENSFCSQLSQDGSSSSAIYTESLQRSSMESSISSDPSLSELTTSSEDCSNFIAGENMSGCERGGKHWKDYHNELHDTKRSSDYFLMESPSESPSDSRTVSLGDTASSQSQLNTNAKGFNSAPMYSGRNTAAILQELLTALSSSTSQRKSMENCGTKSEGTESCSLGCDFRQVEKPQDLAAGYAQYGEDICMKSSFQNSASSNSTDISQESQGNEEGEKDDSITSNESPRVAEMQSEDEHLETARTGHTQVQPGPTKEHAEFADCEALMSAISRLHHIDPEAIGLNVRAGKHHNEGKVMLDVAPGDGLFKCFLDSGFTDKPDDEQTQQFNLGFSSSTTLTPEDDADSIYRSDMESSFRIGYDEAAASNKNLVTDCISEAFKSLSKQLYNFSSSISEHSSATHVLSRVYKQLDEWRAMAANMNLDDMIEKEMNSTTRSWRSIGIETEEVAVVLESSILSGLLEEILLELM